MLTSIVNNNLHIEARTYVDDETGERFTVPNYFKPTKDEEANVRIFRTLVNSEEARVWMSRHHKGIWNWFLSSAAGKKYRPKKFKGRKGVRQYKRRRSTHIDNVDNLYGLFNSPNVVFNDDDIDEEDTYYSNLKDALQPLQESSGSEIKPDNSYEALYNLMLDGYDLITWQRDAIDGEACPTCNSIKDLFISMEVAPGGYMSLPDFLGYKREPVLNMETGKPIKDDSGNEQYNYIKVASPFEHDAPIYDLSHPRCRCILKVCKSNNPDDVKVISADGER